MTFDNWLKSNRTATEEKPSFDEWMKSRNTRQQAPDYAGLLPSPGSGNTKSGTGTSGNTLANTGASAVDEDLTQRILSGQYRSGSQSGSYYSKPDDLMANVGEYASRVQTTGAAANSAYSNYSTAMSEATSAKNDMDLMAAELRAVYAQYQADPSEANSKRYTDLHAQYERAVSGYATLSRTAQRYAEEYNAAAADYADAYSAFTGYQQAEQGRYDAWRGTIREEEDIQAEMDALDTRRKELLSAYENNLVNRPIDENGNVTSWENSTPEQVEELDRQRARLQEEMDWSKSLRYSELDQKEDFAENSAYIDTYDESKVKSTTTTPAMGDATSFGTVYTNYGVDDPLYAYINKDQRVVDMVTTNEAVDGSSFLGYSKEFLLHMTDQEVARYNYLYKSDPKEANRYLDYINSELYRRQREETEKYVRQFAQESPVAASVMSTLMSPLRSVSFFGQLAEYAATGKVNENAGYNKFVYSPNAIRSQVAQDISDQTPGANIRLFGEDTNVFAWLYQHTMSDADFLVNLALFGHTEWANLAMMGTGAGAQTVIEAKERGLSDGQAVALGIISAAAEIVTEKVSVEALMDTPKWNLHNIRYIIKNVLSEGSEEVASDAINLVADIIVSGSKAEFIEYAKEHGVPAAIGHQLLQGAESFLGGGLSGGLFSGLSVGTRYLTSVAERSIGREVLSSEDFDPKAAVKSAELVAQVAGDADLAELARYYGKILDSGKTPGATGFGQFYTYLLEQEGSLAVNNPAAFRAVNETIAKEFPEISEQNATQPATAPQEAQNAADAQAVAEALPAPEQQQAEAGEATQGEKATVANTETTGYNEPTEAVQAWADSGTMTATAGNDTFRTDGSLFVRMTEAEAQNETAGGGESAANREMQLARYTARNGTQVKTQPTVMTLQQNGESTPVYVVQSGDRAAAYNKNRVDVLDSLGGTLYSTVSDSGVGVMVSVGSDGTINGFMYSTPTSGANITADRNETASLQSVSENAKGGVTYGRTNGQRPGQTGPVVQRAGEQGAGVSGEPAERGGSRQEAGRNQPGNRGTQESRGWAAHEVEGKTITAQAAAGQSVSVLDKAVTQDHRDAEALAKKNGANVSFYKGYLQVDSGDGNTIQVRGVYDPATGKIYVMADGRVLAIDLTRHELMHDKIDQKAKAVNGETVTAELVYTHAIDNGYVSEWEFWEAVKIYSEIHGISSDAAALEIVCDGADHINDIANAVQDGAYSRTRWQACADLMDRVLDGLNRSANELTNNAFEMGGENTGTERTAGQSDENLPYTVTDDVTAENAGDAGMKYSRVVDPAKLRELENGDTVKVYRAMQVIDGKLYPPMAAQVKEADGKAQLVEPTEIGAWYQSDERPDLLEKNGKFVLRKGNGTTIAAAYNPYFHTSSTPLNDQFSSAYNRPNLVVVEGEIPKSELTSGYRAQGAKDAVGQTRWHAGPVASKLKGDKARRVYLSRWMKVNRIVSDAETARIIADVLKGENVAIPENVVTPSLLKELQKQGVATEKAATKYSAAPSTEITAPTETKFDSLYTTLSDGRIKPVSVDDLSMEDWGLIYKAVKKLGYDIRSAQDAKETFGKRVGEVGFNKEQSDAIRRAYGVAANNGVHANPQREARAIKEFGKTGDFREAGYLLRNGSMLDFSGKKEGGPARVRYMDHREIGRVFEDGEIPEEKTRYGENTAYMNAFISEGNIRLMDGQGVTIGEMEPTAQQYTVLKQFIDRVLRNEDYFYLDLSNNDGYTIESRDYSESDGATKIIRDIKAYFKTGELPYRSDLSQFRYSRRLQITPEQDAEYLAAAESGDTETAQRMVDEAAKAAGYDLHLYHGSKKGGGFTVFKGWQYFTGNKRYAERYAQRGNEKSLYEVYAKSDRMFDTRNEEDRAVFKEYRGEYGMGEIQASGLPDWTDGYDLSDMIEENDLDYDGIILDEGGDFVDGKPVSRGPSYVLRESNQIKSADPVTYDDAGNVIPLSERFNQEEQDIRYSRVPASIASLQRENENLREQVEKWRNETKLTKEPTARQDDVRRVARALVKDYDSTLKAADIETDLMKLVQYIMRGESMFTNVRGDISWETVKEMGVNLARRIIESSQVLNEGDDPGLYREIRKALKKPMVISDMYAKDIAPDGFGEWYRRNHGRVNVAINRQGMPVDTAYQELSATYPEWFPADITNPADQVRQMLDVVNTLEPVYENPYSFDMAMAIEEAANDIIDRAISEEIRQTSLTFADRQQKKLEETKAKYRRRIQEIREQRDQQMADLREYYRDRAKNERAIKEERELRKKLLRVARRLQNIKTSRANRALIEDAFGGLDLDTVAMSITDGKVQRLSELKDYILDKTVKGRNDEEYDEYFRVSASTIKALERLNKTRISDLPLDRAKELLNALLNVEAQINAEKRFVNSQLKMDFYDAGVRLIQNVENGPDGPIKATIPSTLNPRSAVRRIAWDYRGNSPLVIAYNEMVEGERQYQIYRREALAPFRNILSNKKWRQDFSGKKARSITVTGLDAKGNQITTEITPAMAVALFLSSKNEDSFAHIAGGGVLVPNMKDYRAGNMEKAYNEGTQIRLGRDELARLWSELNAEDKAFANLLNRYFNTFAPEYLNKTSLALHGYEKFLEKNYYPIHVDKNFLKSDFEQGMMAADDSLARPGFGEERQHSAKPIYLYDANMELTRSVKANGMYATMAIPLQNMNRLLNVQLKNYEGSVQKTLNQKFSDGSASRYLRNYLSAYAGHNKTHDDNISKILRKARNNYAGSALTLGAGTGAKQFASYFAAGAVVKADALRKAISPTAKTGSLAFIDEQTAAHTMRKEGFTSLEMAELTEQGKHIPKLLNWIQAVDVGTTALLKRAAYFDVLSKNQYAEGSEPFKREVVDTYNRIIEQTQPVYTASFRPDILRTDNELLRNLVMFATQPLQNFNVLYDSMQGLRAAAIENHNTNSPESRQELKAAQKQAARAVASQVASSLMFSILQMVVDLARGHKDKYKDKDEDEYTLLSVLRGLGLNMATSGFGMIPGGSYIWEFAQVVTDAVFEAFGKTKPFDARWYGIELGVLDAVTDAGQSVVSLIRKLGKAKEDPEAAVRATIKTTCDTLVLFGLPANNVYRLVTNTAKNIIRTIYRTSGSKYLGEYYALRITDAKGESEYYDNLFKAYNTSASDYEDLYNQMISDGYDEDTIKSRVEDRMKKAQGVSSVDDLDHRYMGPEQQDYYDGVLKKVRNAGIWNDLDADLRDKAKDLIYYLAINSDESSAKTAREKVDGGESVGLSMDEYIIYWLARQYYDQPVGVEGHGGYDRDELIKAIDSVPGLSIDEKSYLWSVYNSKTHTDKNNPYR